jgi:hypothetical protein
MSEPNHEMPEREAETLASRIVYCRALLYAHEFLTEAERDRVQRRTLTWMRRAAPEQSVGP